MKKLMLTASLFLSIFSEAYGYSTPLLNARDSHQTRFGNCLYRLDRDEVRKALAEGADADGKISPQIEEKVITVLKLLFNAGAEIRQDDSTILHGPVIAGAKNVTQYLLENGANYNGVDDRGNTPLTLASEFRHPEIIALLKQYGAEPLDKSMTVQITLISAARRGDLGSMKQALAAGAQANGRNPTGETALTVAIREGNFRVVEELLSSGADPNLPGPYIGLGYSPLHLAVFKPSRSF
jgi:hypothetical protein